MSDNAVGRLGVWRRAKDHTEELRLPLAGGPADGNVKPAPGPESLPESAPAWANRLPVAASAFVVLLGVVVLAGWAIGERALTAASPSLPQMKPLGAVGFVLAGLGIALRGAPTRARRRLASLSAALIAGGGSAVLAAWLLGFSLGPRPSPKTGVAFVLFGLAQLTVDSKGRFGRRAHTFAIASFGFTVCAIGLGYLYGSRSLTSSTSPTGVSVLTEIGLLALLAAVPLERPDRAPARWLWSRGPEGTLIRYLAPCVLLLPPAVGLLHLVGRNAGVYDSGFGVALVVGSLMVALVAMLLVTTGTVERTDRERVETLELYASALEASLNAYVAIDENGLITAWNREAERIFGRPRAQAIGRRMDTLIIPEQHRAAHRAGLGRYLELGESRVLGERLELLALRAAGGEFPIEITISPTEEAGRRTFHAFIADISARREAEAERRLLATVVGGTTDAVTTVDLDGTLTSWNEGAERLYGYTAQEMVGRSAIAAGTPGADHTSEFLPGLLGGEHLTQTNLERRRKDGRVIYVDMTGAPLRDQGGRIVGAAAIARDVTERVLRDQELRRLATVFEQSDDAIIVKSLDGLISEWNRGAERLYGYSAEEAIGRPISILIPSERRGEELALLRRAAAAESSRMETTRVRKDGTAVEVALTVTPVLDAAGEVVAVAVIARDISEARRLARELQAIFDNVPAALVLRDRDGRYRHVNAHVTRSLNVAAEDLIGRRADDHYSPELMAEIRAQDDELVRSRKPQAHEITVPHGDGTVHDYHVVKYPVLDADGEVSALGSFSLDITERKQADRERERALADLEEAQAFAHLGSWWWDPRTDVATWSSEMYRIFGRAPHSGPPRTIGDFLAYVHEDDRDSIGAEYSRLLVGGGPGFELHYRILADDGVERTLHELGRADPQQHGCYKGTVQDVTELRAAERAASEAEERFRRAFDDAPIGMALITLDGRIARANEALGAMCGRTPGELGGVALRELTHPADREQGHEALRNLADGESHQIALDLRFILPAGAPVDVHIQATVLRDSAGGRSQLLCQFQDVTDRKGFEARLQFMADHDPLTGLVNRRKFEAELGRHVAQVKRYGAEGALIVLDIDHFKLVNDMLGHNAGDELIVSIAGVLRRRLRESDVLARLGGDEFAILLPKADEDKAAHVAKAIVFAVRSHSLLLGEEPRAVTTSAGVTMFDRTDQEQLSSETVLIEADLAMYDAKEAGRDGFAFYENSPYRASRTKARLTWAGRIEHALEHDGFALLAQPILDLRSEQIHHHELLIRMLDERGEMIPPATFLYIAERFGLIARIDEWVCGRAIELIERVPSLRLSVNISGRSLGDDRLLKSITEPLRGGRIDAGHLTFEVTETGAVANITQAQSFARQLRDLGCRFALDDFGAGFGSFYYLKHLPFDYVKIDGEFVQHAVTGKIDQLVITAIVSIAQGLGEETIAEFVTSEKTKRMVRRLGVDYAQGHYIGIPVPIEELMDTQLRASQGEFSGTG